MYGPFEKTSVSHLHERPLHIHSMDSLHHVYGVVLPLAPLLSLLPLATLMAPLICLLHRRDDSASLAVGSEQGWGHS